MMADLFDLAILDPNWRYRVWNKTTGSGRSADKHYHTSPVVQMMSLDFLSCMARDSVVDIWVTGPFIREMFDLVDEWNRRYSKKRDRLIYSTVHFVWVKTSVKGDQKMFTSLKDTTNWHFGLGHSTRSNIEYVYSFKRGKGLPRLKTRAARSVRQMILAPIPKQHSQKPDDAQDRLEILYGNSVQLKDETCRPLRRVEFYARREREGWETVGDEVPRNHRLIEDFLRGYADERAAFDPPVTVELSHAGNPMQVFSPVGTL